MWSGTQRKLPSSAHHPLFEVKNGSKGKVFGTDENLDLAILRSCSRLPFLELEDKEDLHDSIPLRIRILAWLERMVEGRA